MLYEKTKKKDGRFLERFIENKSYCVAVVNPDGTIYFHKYFETEAEACALFDKKREEFE